MHMKGKCACGCANFAATAVKVKHTHTGCSIARHLSRSINQVARAWRRRRRQRQSIKYSRVSGVRYTINFNLLGKNIHFLAHHSHPSNRKMYKITFDASNLIKRAWRMAATHGDTLLGEKRNQTRHLTMNKNTRTNREIEKTTCHVNAYRFDMMNDA